MISFDAAELRYFIIDQFFTRIAHPPYRSIILAKALMRYDGGELERGERCAVGAGDGAGGDAVEGVRKLYDWTPWQAP